MLVLRRTILVLTLLTCVLQTQGAELTSPSQCTTLDCWLAGLTVPIPFKQQPLDNGKFVLTVGPGECNGFSVGDVALSSARSEKDPYDTTVVMDVADLTVKCEAEFSLLEVGGLHLHTSGTFTLGVGSGSSLDVRMDLESVSGAFPSAVSVTTCTPDITLVDLVFEGGILDKILDKAITVKAIHKRIDKEVNKVLCGTVMPNVAGTLSATLEGVSDGVQECVVRRAAAPPPPIPPAPPGGLVDLRHNPVVAVLDYVLDNVTAASGLDTLIDKLTGGEGYYSIGLNATLPLDALNGTLEANVTLGEIRLSGLNTWSQLGVLKPSPRSPYLLDSVVSLSGLSANLSFCLDVLYGPLIDEGVLTDCGTLRGSLVDATFNVSILLELDEAYLNGLAPSQLISPGNLLASVDRVGIQNAWFNASFVDVVLTGLNGTAGDELNSVLLAALQFLEYGFTSSIPAVLDCIAVPLAMDDVNEAIDAAVNELKEEFPETPPQDQEASFYRLSVILSAVGFVIAAVGVSGYLYVYHKRAEQVHASHRSLPLALRPELSPTLRFIAVYVTLANLACIVNVSAGTVAFLFAFFKLGDTEAHLPSLYSFSLGSSIRAFWDAGVYPPSILLAVFSGAWPYAKHLGLLAAVLVPPHVLARRVRLYIIHVVNFMSTWLLISVYSTFLVMITLHVQLSAPPDVPPAQQLTVDVAVQPVWGMFVEVWTLCVCLVVTSIVLKLHRDEVVAEQDATETMETGSLSLTKHLTSAPETAHLVSLSGSAHPGIKAVVLVGLVAAIVCISLSAVVDLFTISLHGAIALVLDTLNLPTQKSYSLFVLGEAFANATHLPITFGVRVLQILYYLASLFFPLLGLVLGGVVWFVPMPVDTQRTLVFGVEVLVAWSGVDVAAAAIVAGLAQLQTFVYSVTHDYCTALRPILNEYLSEPLQGDTHCFDAHASLVHGCWIMAAGAVLYIVVMAIIIHHADRTLFVMPKPIARSRRRITRINSPSITEPLLLNE